MSDHSQNETFLKAQKSSSNIQLQSYPHEMKPHLPPLDPKAPNDNTLKKRFMQKGLIASTDMNGAFSILDSSAAGVIG